MAEKYDYVMKEYALRLPPCGSIPETAGDH